MHGADWAKNHPALSLFSLAVLLGLTPVAIVSLGLLPFDYMKLGALSAGTAGTGGGSLYLDGGRFVREQPDGRRAVRPSGSTAVLRSVKRITR